MACEEHSITAILHPISTARRSIRCMSVASGVVRPAFFFSLPSRYSTVPVIATGSPAASGIEQLAANRDEQTARPGLSRIVRNVGHDCGFVAKQLTVNRLRDFSERYTLSLHDDRR